MLADRRVGYAQGFRLHPKGKTAAEATYLPWQQILEESRLMGEAMPFEYVPLLHHLEALYRMPRGMERFRAYLSTVLNAQGDDVDLIPLVSANPMAKEHALEYVQQLMAIDAETLAEAATLEAAKELSPLSEHLRVSLVVLDDSKGGWTHRYTTLKGLWGLSVRELEHTRRYGWVSVPCWTSEAPSPEGIRLQTRLYLYRAAWAYREPIPRTLREILTYEGQALAFAGAAQWLDVEELAYTRAVLEPYLDSTHYPTLLVALEGDVAAESLGYQPLGLSPKAGLALALAEASTSRLS